MYLIILVFLLIFPMSGPQPLQEEYDICIYGGTSAGVMAGVQAARMGQSVVIVEPSRHVGGMSVEGLGGSDINNHKEFKNDAAVGGLALEFYQQIAAHYGIRDFEAQRQDSRTWRFEPHVAQQVFDSLVAVHNIKVYYGERLKEDRNGVGKEDARIREIRTQSGKTIRAKVFIDATYEGDLLHQAGVTTFIGREGNAAYGETKNGIRHDNTYRQFAVKVDPYQIPGDPSSGLIATVQDEPLGEEGAPDHRIQAYCFRMCLTRDQDNQIPFSKPQNYDRSHYEIYLRYLDAGGKLYTPYAGLPNGKTDLGAWHDLSHNLYGMNHDYPGGDYATRARVLQQHRDFTQGLFYFLANDTAVDEQLRREWSQWGLAADEFQDNGGWPRMFYVREARRMVSDYVITEHHTRRKGQEPVPDPVAIAFWPPDTHHVRRIVRDGYVYNEGFVFGGESWAPFGISYRSLLPKAEEATNLLTPTCLSSTHVAYGAIRLEWTFMALGQAAGTAAALAVKQKKLVQEIDYQILSSRLLSDGQVLEVDYKFE